MPLKAESYVGCRLSMRELFIFLLSLWMSACSGGEKQEAGALDAQSPLDSKIREASGLPRNDTMEELQASSDTLREQDQNQWHTPCPPDSLEERMVELGTLSLNVACMGSGPTVVFLHGFPEFHYSWKKVMEELSTEFRLIAPDQRGYNLSDKPDELEAYELKHLIQDIEELLPIISPEPVILVAHDWGGPVGWGVAHSADAHIRGFISTNGPHPMRFAELIENDPDQKSASSYMSVFRSPAAEALLSADTLMESYADLLSDEDKLIYKKALNQPGAITGGLNWYRANDLKPDTVETLMNSLLAQVPVPVTVMWGMDDIYCLSQNSEGLESYAPELKVETFDGVDHWIEHRIPGEIARAIREMDQKTAQAAEKSR